ncbi:MAG: ribonuclease D [Balneolaceae bacterium]|nr:ribonuclease D [Balneolaceae bacterium]MBO6547502.1 ribonuclease D [Balneolaceae bacterium]MBO6647551.1 ribonuclease D [Balneolaceae bacterium]
MKKLTKRTKPAYYEYPPASSLLQKASLREILRKHKIRLPQRETVTKSFIRIIISLFKAVSSSETNRQLIRHVAFTYISTSEQLKQCITHLSKQSEIAIDLEFDKNRYRYGFNLCLMQIYIDDACYLIDPLSSELEISDIFPLLENPEITKVAFSFGEDIRLLHHIGCIPKGIYDLSFAIALLDYPPTSLTNHLKDIVGVEVGKSSQQSNWFNRPLSQDQLEYAASDVLYLFELRDALVLQLKEKKIEDWVKQENEAFESADYSNENHNEILKEKYKNGLNQVGWYVFSALMMYRDNQAEKMNRPPFHIIDRGYLKELASNPDAIKSWNSKSSIHKSLRKESIKNEIDNLIREKLKEAKSLGLSQRKKATTRLSKEEYEAYKGMQQKVSEAKAHVFKPIQKEMESRYGKHARAFILSNRTIAELVEGDFSNYLPYKQQLIEGLAEKLDLPLSDYVQS